MIKIGKRENNKKTRIISSTLHERNKGDSNSNVWKALDKPLNTGLNLPGQNAVQRYNDPGQSINQSINLLNNLLKSRRGTEARV